MKRSTGITLIELLVVVALIGAILVLAGPAFRDMILMQRLRSINSALVTDMQFARAEAVARRNFTRVQFDANSGVSCYTIYTTSIPNPATRCSCLSAPAASCTGSGLIELKTVSVPSSLGVSVIAPARTGVSTWEPTFAFDWRTGGLYANPLDTAPVPLDLFVVEVAVDAARKLSTRLNQAGRPQVCTPSGSNMSEAACP